MKKFVIPIILAAVLGVGGGVTAIMLNRPTLADKNLALPELKYGNYYLNGDKNSDMHFELTDNYLALRIEGDGIAKIKNVLLEKGSDNDTADTEARALSNDYCAENPYKISVFGTTNTPYQLMIHWNENASGPVYGGTGFTYNGIDTIKCAPFGDFILVED